MLTIVQLPEISERDFWLKSKRCKGRPSFWPSRNVFVTNKQKISQGRHTNSRNFKYLDTIKFFFLILQRYPQASTILGKARVCNYKRSQQIHDIWQLQVDVLGPRKGLKAHCSLLRLGRGDFTWDPYFVSNSVTDC